MGAPVARVRNLYRGFGVGVRLGPDRPAGAHCPDALDDVAVRATRFLHGHWRSRLPVLEGRGLTAPPTKLRREWTAKLAAAGFEDLESSRDPDGPLSDRGNLHPVEHTQAEERRLVERMEDGSDYQAWARDILHRGRWRNATERRIWELHCDGMGDRGIAAALTVNRHRVQAVISNIKAKAAQRWQQRKDTTPCRERQRAQWQARKAARQLSEAELVRVMASLSSPRSSTV